MVFFFLQNFKTHVYILDDKILFPLLNLKMKWSEQLSEQEIITEWPVRHH